MSDPSSILGDMIAVADEQVENLDSSLEQIQEQIDSFNEKATGIEDGMCTPAKDEMTDYLDNTKFAEIESTYGDPFNTPFSIDYGINYGTIDYTTGGIIDFRILDSSGTVMYEYLGANWDSDVTITKLVGDYSFGNDYLTKPFTDGATYGIYANITALESAVSLLNSNKSKIENSKTAFEDYT